MKIMVQWEKDLEIHGNVISFPTSYEEVEIPESVYEDGYTQDGAVEDWLSDNYGWLVRDWRVKETVAPFFVGGTTLTAQDRRSD